MSPRACYDEGKRFAETCVATYRQVYGLDAKIARVFTTYGPRMQLRHGLLVPDFILDALEGRNLVIYGNPETSLSLCFVTDTVDGLNRLMHAGPEVSLVNIGHDTVTTVGQVAEKIITMIKSPSQIVLEEPLAFITLKGMPDLRRAKENLGWLPLVRLEDGLRKTIDYAIANKQAVAYHGM